MKNKIIHALTNSPGPFKEPLFGIATDFIPKEESAEEAELRKLLFLTPDSPAYYLRAYLSILEGYPQVRDYFGEVNPSVRAWDFPSQSVEIDGGELLTQPGRIARYTDALPRSLPVVLTYHVDWAAGNYAKLTAEESGIVTQAEVVVAGKDPRKILNVRWPVQFPFEGPLQLNQFWLEGARVTLKVRPSRFPSREMIDRVRRNAYLGTLLTKYELVDEFHSSDDPNEQLAIVLLALGQSNTAVYPIAAPVVTTVPDRIKTVEIITESKTAPDRSVFAFVGDFGEGTAEVEDVAALIKSWYPEFVVTLGDNWYDDGTLTFAGLEGRSGKYYRDFMFPYQSFRTPPRVPLTSTATRQNFYVLIGNHDRDPVKKFPLERTWFSMPKIFKDGVWIDNPGYYDFERAGVHFLMADSGYDNSQVNRQPDGVDGNSIQAKWFAERIKENRAKWRLLLIHHPLYTSTATSSNAPVLSGDGYLAYPALRWPMIDTMPIDCVLGGHAHNYERLAVNGKPYILNGIGGRELYEFTTPSPHSLFRFNAQFGAQRVTIFKDRMVMDFIDIDGILHDSFEIVK